MGEAGGGLRLFLVSSVFLGPGLRQAARLAGLVTMIWAWSSGGSCPRQARLLNISSELSLSHSPHPEANTPLSPAGSWPPSVLICDFILPPNGGSNSELGSCPTGPAPSFSSLGSLLLFERILAGSALPLSIWCCMSRCVGPAGLELARQGSQQAANPLQQWTGNPDC